MLAYKFLRPGRLAPFTRFAWPTDEWVEAQPPLEACRRGVHACRLQYLPEWLESELWQIELDGEVAEADGLIVAQRGRLESRVDEWDDGTAREFARACAGRLAERAAADDRFAPYAEDAAAIAESTTDRKFYALVSYVARHAAEDVAGGSDTERAWQADWLTARLDLQPHAGP